MTVKNAVKENKDCVQLLSFSFSPWYVNLVHGRSWLVASFAQDCWSRILYLLRKQASFEVYISCGDQTRIVELMFTVLEWFSEWIIWNVINMCSPVAKVLHLSRGKPKGRSILSVFHSSKLRFINKKFIRSYVKKQTGHPHKNIRKCFKKTETMSSKNRNVIEREYPAEKN